MISLSDVCLFARPTIAFAPMEGVTDAPMREWMGKHADFDYGVTEFIRVTDTPVPAKVFLRDVPEIARASKTRTGFTIQTQLLGGNAGRLAESAGIAIDEGAVGIDLNFGCPAPTVNRNDGGATLLKYPERIEEIVAAVRARVPTSMPVSAKLRLGFDDPSVILENATRAQNGGATWITIHARTKVNGYIPPAYWKLIRPVTENLRIPVIANGEMWTLDDVIQCTKDSGTKHVMLGRGALANPFLAATARGFFTTGERSEREPTGEEWLSYFREFKVISDLSETYGPYTLKRLKQWMKYITMKKNREWFEATKRCETVEAFFAAYEAVTSERAAVAGTNTEEKDERKWNLA